MKGSNIKKKKSFFCSFERKTSVPLTEESLDIFRAALLWPVSVLQVPDGALLAGQQVLDL